MPLTPPGSEGAMAALPWRPLLPWQRACASTLLRARAIFPPALLVHGARGLGKHALALNLAQGLLCETPNADGLACGRCPGCRYAVAGQHPDLLRLELTAIDEESGELRTLDTIAIDRIRGLIAFAQLTSHRQRAKVAVIAPADRMNAPAANALLKTLEEPPPGTFFILISAHPARVAPTIVSRCQRFAAPRPTRDEARSWLAAQGVGDPDLALAEAAYAPLVALEHADPGWQRERRAWIEALGEPDRLSPPLLSARIEAGGRDERKTRLAAAIDWLLAWTADLARVAAGDVARQNPDAATALAALAGKVAIVPLFRYHRSLLQQRALLAHPLSSRLVVEAALIDYRELFA